MLTSSPPKKDAGHIPVIAPADDNLAELRFIAELGRSLLFTVHPKKVASRVAEAIRNGIDARACVFVAEIENIGLVSCGYSENGELEDSFFAKKSLKSG